MPRTQQNRLEAPTGLINLRDNKLLILWNGLKEEENSGHQLQELITQKVTRL